MYGQPRKAGSERAPNHSGYLLASQYLPLWSSDNSPDDNHALGEWWFRIGKDSFKLGGQGAALHRSTRTDTYVDPTVLTVREGGLALVSEHSSHCYTTWRKRCRRVGRKEMGAVNVIQVSSAVASSPGTDAGVVRVQFVDGFSFWAGVWQNRHSMRCTISPATT